MALAPVCVVRRVTADRMEEMRREMADTEGLPDDVALRMSV